ncbi:glutamate receptor 2.8-like [Rutidosis leptorrhynchoides]|uniref:glutamate receptor 2.8-like n=1 Tax=Rutidosis leptorrhynchoides TaxID=125765 RepID=UPI003A99A302
MIIWFPVSTFFFNEGKIVNKNSKVVLVMWLCMIFMVVQIFTATLSSWLTLDQLRPRLPSGYENFGYQNGSFLKDYIMDKYDCNDTNLVPLNSVEEYKIALSSGRVSVVFDELPFIELFLNKYGSDYMKFGPLNQESGIAFALPRESPFLSIFTRAVINVTEGDVMMDMMKKYLGFRAPNESLTDQTLPQSLDIQSFIGLFIFMGTTAIAAIICSEISLWRANKKILPETEDEP